MWIVEYSKSQKAYHVSKESETLEQEIKTFENNGWIGDWKVLARFDTSKEAHDFYSKLLT